MPLISTKAKLFNNIQDIHAWVTLVPIFICDDMIGLWDKML